MTEEFITTQAYEPNEDGLWSGPFYIDSKGNMTHNQKDAVCHTDTECPKDHSWCFVSNKWVNKKALKDKNIFGFEIQYVDGVETKRNFTSHEPEFIDLSEQYLSVRPNDGPFNVISKNKFGKMTIYTTNANIGDFGVPKRNWGPIHAVSIYADGSQSIKCYDLSIKNYKLPKLPEGATINKDYFSRAISMAGVACVWMNGKELPNREIYFVADRTSVEEWVEPLGLKLPNDYEIDYWGIVFNRELEILHLKALKWIMRKGNDITKIRTEYNKVKKEKSISCIKDFIHEKEIVKDENVIRKCVDFKTRPCIKVNGPKKKRKRK